MSGGSYWGPVIPLPEITDENRDEIRDLMDLEAYVNTLACEMRARGILYKPINMILCAEIQKQGRVAEETARYNEFVKRWEPVLEKYERGRGSTIVYGYPTVEVNGKVESSDEEEVVEKDSNDEKVDKSNNEEEEDSNDENEEESSNDEEEEDSTDDEKDSNDEAPKVE